MCSRPRGARADSWSTSEAADRRVARSSSVTSSTDCIYHDRQQRVTFVVGNGAIRHDVATASGNQIRTASGNTIRTLDNSMKVTVLVTQLATTKRLMVTAQDHIVCTASGNLVRIANN